MSPVKTNILPLKCSRLFACPFNSFVKDSPLPPCRTKIAYCSWFLPFARLPATLARAAAVSAVEEEPESSRRTAIGVGMAGGISPTFGTRMSGWDSSPEVSPKGKVVDKEPLLLGRTTKVYGAKMAPRTWTVIWEITTAGDAIFERWNKPTEIVVDEPFLVFRKEAKYGVSAVK